MKALLISVSLLWGSAALAQGADLPDSSVPDASVGEGGGDRMNEEGEGMQANGACLSSKDCERGFNCVSNRCVYTGVRTAGGCAGGIGAMLLSVGLLGVLWRSRSDER
jgi:hypothetical protein